MQDNIKIGEWYETPTKRIMVHSVEDGMLNYIIEGVMTFFPMYCIEHEFWEMVENGARIQGVLVRDSV